MIMGYDTLSFGGVDKEYDLLLSETQSVNNRLGLHIYALEGTIRGELVDLTFTTEGPGMIPATGIGSQPTLTEGLVAQVKEFFKESDIPLDL